MSKKVLGIAIICLSVFLVSGELFATVEGSALVGFLGSKVWSGADEFTTRLHFSGVVTMGAFFRNIIGLEASAFLLSGHRGTTGRNAVYSLNATLNIPFKKFSLFATIGAGYRPHTAYSADLNANIGGGVKIRLKNKWGIRVEYRTWPGLEEGSLGDSLLAGVSYFF